MLTRVQGPVGTNEGNPMNESMMSNRANPPDTTSEHETTDGKDAGNFAAWVEERDGSEIIPFDVAPN